ncbi:hypothetical protein KJ564_07820 [bacterium]|nr:hypothetical protein [bacterium]
MGDSDPKAWIIAIVGGAIGGLFGSLTAVIIGAYLPTFIFQLGLPDVSDEMGIGQSQGGKGFSRAFIALFASMIPSIPGIIVGVIVTLLV